MSTSQAQALAAEVERILLSPYAVSLKNLQTLLRNTSPYDLREWCASHSHDLQPLATVLVENLKVWPYTIDIMLSLAPLTALRDEILKYAPELLPSLIDKALNAPENINPTCDLCISLLAPPLPSHLAIPENAQAFFCQLFKHAVKFPSPQTLEPVYTLLEGGCSSLLEILPRQTLDCFQDQLTKMMKTIKRIEDQLLSLLCLGVMAVMSRSGSATHKEAQKFFGAERASKTIHLLALQVIYACKGNQDGINLDARKRIKLARQILTAIDAKQRHEWSDKNSQVARKLHEKSLEAGMDSILRLDVLAFISELTEVVNLHSTVVHTFQNLLLDIETWSSLERQVLDDLSLLVPLFAARLDEMFWQDMMRIVLRACVGSSEYGFQVAFVLTEFTAQLTKTIGRLPQVRKTIETTFQSLRSMLKELLTVRIENKSIGTRNLSFEVSSLILNIALTARPYDGGLDSEISLAIMEMQLRLASKINPAPDRQKVRVTTFSICEQPCTPEQPGGSHWKENLALQLRQDSRHQEETIEHIVGEVCRDLEQRCENVEKPLREWKAKCEDSCIERNSIQNLVKNTEAKLHEMQAELDTTRASAAKAETEYTLLASKYADLSQMNEELSSCVQKAINDGHLALSEERDVRDRLELELRADLACQAVKEGRQKEEIQHLKEALHAKELSSTEEAIQYQNSTESLQKHLQDTKATLQLQSEDIIFKDRKISMLELLETGSKHTRQQLQGEISRLKTNLDDLTAELLDLKKTSDERFRTLNLEHKFALSAIETRAATSEEILETKLRDLQAELASNEEGKGVALSERELKIGQLQEKVYKLSSECQEKSNELAKARKLKANMLTAMGLQTENGYQTPKFRHKSFPDDASAIPKSEYALLSSSSDPAHSPNAQTSKRNKTWKSSDANWLCEFSANTEAIPSRRTDSTRLPLVSINSGRFNGSHDKRIPPRRTQPEVHFKITPERQAAKLPGQLFLDDLSFGESRFGTSDEVSPGQTGTICEVDENNETTVEC